MSDKVCTGLNTQRRTVSEASCAHCLICFEVEMVDETKSYKFTQIRSEIHHQDMWEVWKTQLFQDDLSQVCKRDITLYYVEKQNHYSSKNELKCFKTLF